MRLSRFSFEHQIHSSQTVRYREEFRGVVINFSYKVGDYLLGQRIRRSIPAIPLRFSYGARIRGLWNFYSVCAHKPCGTLMVCLYHGDYGPADPAFSLSAPSQSGLPGWVVDARLLKDARNIGEAEAIQRHLIRAESVSWLRPGL
jgi:hypothetical protein